MLLLEPEVFIALLVYCLFEIDLEYARDEMRSKYGHSDETVRILLGAVDVIHVR